MPRVTANHPNILQIGPAIDVRAQAASADVVQLGNIVKAIRTTKHYNHDPICGTVGR